MIGSCVCACIHFNILTFTSLTLLPFLIMLFVNGVFVLHTCHTWIQRNGVHLILCFCKPRSRLQTSRSTWLLCFGHEHNWMRTMFYYNHNHRVHPHSLFRHWARRLCKLTKSKYRRQVLISHLGTQGEPRATVAPHRWNVLPASLKGRSVLIPAVGFDPTSSELWALRASSAPRRW